MRQAVGAAVQFGIAQGQVVEAQRRRIRLCQRLGFDQMMHPLPLRVVTRRGVPVLYHLLTFSHIEHGQVTQTLLAALKHGLQQIKQMAAIGLYRVCVEMRTCKAELHRQRVTHVHQHRQREAGLLAGIRQAETDTAAAALFQGLGHRVVFKHQNVIEQGLTALPGPALDIEQWRVIVLTQGDVQRLHGVQPVTQRLLRAWAGNDRQGVDEQADLLLDALEFGRPPSRGRTKGDAGLAGIALQHQQPGRLHHGIDGDPALTGKGVQAGGLPGIQLLYPLDLPLPFTTGCPVRGPGQQGGVGRAAAVRL